MKLGYIRDAISPETRHACVGWLEKMCQEFKPDMIAVRGVSGCIMGNLISYATGIPLCIIRKDDGNHSGLDIEVDWDFRAKPGPSYVIIDDLIASGTTVRTINNTLTRELAKLNHTIFPRLLAVFCYDGRYPWNQEDPGAHTMMLSLNPPYDSPAVPVYYRPISDSKTRL